ncbi:hypothetical protein HDU93_007603 [Gonapodya sp. JEL0774]|nr:hypothetical protein HDU93_007603 [Gonapodya sp. JEL0774]
MANLTLGLRKENKHAGTSLGKKSTTEVAPEKTPSIDPTLLESTDSELSDSSGLAVSAGPVLAGQWVANKSKEIAAVDADIEKRLSDPDLASLIGNIAKKFEERDEKRIPGEFRASHVKSEMSLNETLVSETEVIAELLDDTITVRDPEHTIRNLRDLVVERKYGTGAMPFADELAPVPECSNNERKLCAGAATLVSQNILNESLKKEAAHRSGELEALNKTQELAAIKEDPKRITERKAVAEHKILELSAGVTEVVELEEEVQRLKCSIAHIEYETGQLENRNQELKLAEDLIRNDLENSKVQSENLQQLSEGQKVQIAELQDECSKQKQAVLELRKALENVQAQSTLLINQFTSEKQIYEGRIRVLTEDTAFAKSSAMSATELMEALQQRIEMFRNEREIVERSASALQAMNLRLSEELMKLKKNVVHFVTVVKLAEGVTIRIKVRHGDTREAFEARADKLRYKDMPSNPAVGRQLQDWEVEKLKQSSVATLMNELQAFADETDNSEIKQEEGANTDTASTDIDSALQAQSTDCESRALETAFKALPIDFEQEILGLTSERDELAARLHRKDAQVTHLNNQVRQHIASKQEVEKNLNVALQKLRDLRKDLEKEKLEKAQLQKNYSHRSESIEHKLLAKQAELDIAKRECQEKTTELLYMTFHKQERERLSTENDHLISVNQQLTEENQEIQAKAQKATVQIQEYVRDMDHLRKSLESQLKDSQRENEQLRATISQLNSRIQSGLAENDQLRRMLVDREETIGKQLSNLQKFNHLFEENARLTEDLGFWRAQKKEYESKINTLIDVGTLLTNSCHSSVLTRNPVASQLFLSQEVKSLEKIIEVDRKQMHSREVAFERAVAIRNDFESELARVKVENSNLVAQLARFDPRRGTDEAPSLAQSSAGTRTAGTVERQRERSDEYVQTPAVGNSLEGSSRVRPPPGLGLNPTSPVSAVSPRMSHFATGAVAQQSSASGNPRLNRCPAIAAQPMRQDHEFLEVRGGWSDPAMPSSRSPILSQTDQEKWKIWRGVETTRDDESVADTVMSRETNDASVVRHTALNQPSFLPSKYHIWFYAEITPPTQSRIKFTVYKVLDRAVMFFTVFVSLMPSIHHRTTGRAFVRNGSASWYFDGAIGLPTMDFGYGGRFVLVFESASSVI